MTEQTGYKDSQSLRALIAEDDEQIQNLISYILQEQGFACCRASSFQQALQQIAQTQQSESGGGPFDLVLLDLGFADGDGLNLIPEAARQAETALIVISARNQEDQKVKALELGADDYLTKPFGAAELVARVKAVMRRKNRHTPVSAQILQVRDLRLDTGCSELFRGQEQIHLSPLEFSLLKLMMEHAGKTVTTRQILEALYGKYATADTQSLRSLMASLRRRVEPDPARPVYLLTEIGVGYRMPSH